MVGDLVEQRLHRRLDRGVVDALLGPEHDRADLAGALAAELLVEDVEARLRLDVGQVEVVAEVVADRAGDAVRDDEDGDPEAEDEPAPVVAPGTEAGEHAGSLEAGRTETVTGKNLSRCDYLSDRDSRRDERPIVKESDGTSVEGSGAIDQEPRDREALVAAFDRETRRMGSMATLHNHAIARRRRPPPDGPGVPRPARLGRAAHRRRDRRAPRPHQRSRHRAHRPARGRRLGAARARPVGPPPGVRAPLPRTRAASCGRSTSR